MFEIFDNTGEMTFIFKGENLIYANNAACLYLKSYEKSLLKKQIRDLFDDESVNSIYENCEKEKDFKIFLNFKKGKREKFKIKLIIELDEEFMLVQSDKKVKPEGEYEYNRIIAPRMIYDPIKAGKFNIANYEISEIYMKVQEDLNILSEIPSAREKAKEISVAMSRILEQIRNIADELIDVDQKYVMIKSVFSANALLGRIATRMNDTFKLENVDAQIKLDISKCPEVVVMGDYMKIGGAITTLATLLVNILTKKRKKAEIILSLEKEDGFCRIDIISKDVTINKKTYDEIILSPTEIINLNRYAENKLTLNIHVAGAYIELNDGELSVKRVKGEGTVMSVKLPLVKKKYFFGEQVDNKSCQCFDNIISKIVIYIINNV